MENKLKAAMGAGGWPARSGCSNPAGRCWWLGQAPQQWEWSVTGGLACILKVETVRFPKGLCGNEKRIEDLV